jgi:hypothetical protein
VHRMDGGSKTVTKNMREGFFKNKKIKERHDPSAAGIAEMYFHGLIPDGMFTRCARLFIIDIYFSMVFMSSQPSAVRLTQKSASRIVWKMKGSDLPPVRRTSMPEQRTDQPEELTFLSLLTFDALTLTMQKTAAFIGLTFPHVLTADVGVKTPSPTKCGHPVLTFDC